MMNMLNSRLLNAALIAIAAVLVPVAALAQDVSTMGDNASGFIGGLVIWLLPIGGIFAVGAMISIDKQVQANRIGTTVRR